MQRFNVLAVLVAGILSSGAVLAETNHHESSTRWHLDDDDDGAGGCRKAGRGKAVTLPATKLYLEHNATAGDTGVHGLFDGLDWTELCVYDPSGRQVLAVQPKAQLKTQAISGIFFESREPPNAQVPIADILANFPEGLYSVRGTTLDGKRMTGAATFTHNIPAAPVVIFPQDGAVVSASDLVIMWEPVTQTLTGGALSPTAYEVIVIKDVANDPHGFSRPNLDVHVPPTQTTLSIPSEFLEPNTAYKLEVLVLEVSGNQTITEGYFQTQ